MVFDFVISSPKPRWDVWAIGIKSGRTKYLGWIELKGLEFIFVKTREYITDEESELIQIKLDQLNRVGYPGGFVRKK